MAERIVKNKWVIGSLLAALAGWGGLNVVGDHDEADGFSAFSQNIDKHRAAMRPGLKTAPARSFEIVADPDTGKRRMVYYSDCDPAHLRDDLMLERSKKGLGDEDVALLLHFFLGCAKRDSDQAIHLSYEVEPGTALSAISANRRYSIEKLVYHFNLNNIGAAGVTRAVSEAVARNHEKGHVMDKLLGGMPEDLDSLPKTWEEGVADSFAILALARDTGSLYPGGVWSEFRMASALPRSGRDGEVLYSDPAYFNPFVLEASLRKAAALLADGSLKAMDDVQIAKIARAITRDKVMPAAEMKRFSARVSDLDDVLGRLSAAGRPVSPDRAAAMFQAAGGVDAGQEAYILWIRQALGDFRTFEKRVYEEAQVSVPSPSSP